MNIQNSRMAVSQTYSELIWIDNFVLLNFIGRNNTAVGREKEIPINEDN